MHRSTCSVVTFFNRPHFKNALRISVIAFLATNTTKHFLFASTQKNDASPTSNDATSTPIRSNTLSSTNKNSFNWISESTKDPVFLVMNKERGLLRFHSLNDGRLLGKFRAISGLNSGDKNIEGDRKTPEGIYTIMREIPKENLVSLHGATAYELNYPNFYDKLNKKSGSGIWIHGVEKEDRLEKATTDTRGCVALGNSEVVAIRPLIKFRQTPILILDKENNVDEFTAPIENGSGPYSERILSWARAWASKDIDQYMSFYHENFKSKGMNFKAWQEYKNRLTKVYKKIDVSISDIRVLVHPKYSVAYFIQNYRSDKITATSQKRLVLLGSGAEAKILSEDVIQEEMAPLSELSQSM